MRVNLYNNNKKTLKLILVSNIKMTICLSLFSYTLTQTHVLKLVCANIYKFIITTITTT